MTPDDLLGMGKGREGEEEGNGRQEEREGRKVRGGEALGTGREECEGQ